jgi:hypothetical protein
MKPKEEYLFFRGAMEQPVYTTIRPRQEPASATTPPDEKTPSGTSRAGNRSNGGGTGLPDSQARPRPGCIVYRPGSTFPGFDACSPSGTAGLARPDLSPASCFAGASAYVEGTTPKTFDAFKFRTMISDADEYLRRNPHLLKEFQRDYKLREDPRITPLGHKLRTTSLDELPQL